MQQNLKIIIKIKSNHPNEEPNVNIQNANKLSSELINDAGDLKNLGMKNWKNCNKNLLMFLKQIVTFLCREYTFNNRNSKNSIQNTYKTEENLYYEIYKLNNTMIFTVKNIHLPKILLQRNSPTEKKTLLKTKYIVSENAIYSILRRPYYNGIIELIFNPLLIVIQCNSMTFAKLLLSCAEKSNYMESGINFDKEKFIVNIRLSSASSTPLTNYQGKSIVNKEFLKLLLTKVNRFLLDAEKQIQNLTQALKELLKDSRIYQIYEIETKLNENSTKVSLEMKKNENISKNHMNMLNFPNEIIQKIILLLDGKTIKNCKSINKEWYKIVDNLIWRSKFAFQTLEKKLENNWKTNNYTTKYKIITLDFQYPELVAESSSSFLIFTSNRGYDKYALYNMNKEEMWIIEENKTNTRSAIFKMNESLIVIYKESKLYKGITKVYSIQKRKVIWTEPTNNLLEITLDQNSKNMTIILFFQKKIEVLSFNSTFKLKKLTRLVNMKYKPNFPFYVQDYLTFGIYDEKSKAHSFYIWYIPPESESITSNKHIQNLENFVNQDSKGKTIIHNAIFIQELIISHGCFDGNYKTYCCVRITNEKGILMRNLLFNDSLKQTPYSCLGLLSFTTAAKMLIIHRRYTNEGLYIIHEKDFLTKGVNINISNIRISDLDQFKQYDNLVQRKFCRFMVNKTFAVSISMEENINDIQSQQTNIALKILNYYGHN